MTRDEAVSLMKKLLGFRRNLDDECVTALKAAQTTLEAGPTKPWFLLTERATIATRSGEQRVRVPDTMLVEADNLHLYYIPDDTEEAPVKLTKNAYDTLREAYGEEEPGDPETYALVGNYFMIFPEPDDDYTLEMRVFAQDEVLDSNIENKWLKYVPYALIGKAGILVASMVRDKDALASFTQMEREGRMILMANDIERDLNNQELQIGGSHV